MWTGKDGGRSCSTRWPRPFPAGPLRLCRDQHTPQRSPAGAVVLVVRVVLVMVDMDREANTAPGRNATTKIYDRPGTARTRPGPAAQIAAIDSPDSTIAVAKAGM